MPRADSITGADSSHLTSKPTVISGNEIAGDSNKDIASSVQGSDDDVSASLTSNNIVPAPPQLDPNVDRKLTDFLDIAETLRALDQVKELADWDMEIYMPSAASDTRATQMKVVKTLHHKLITSKRLENLLEFLGQEDVRMQLSSNDRALVELIRKEHVRSKKIPPRHVQELSETTTKAYSVWEEAKKETKDFSSFVPLLERIIALKRQEAEIIGYKGSPYDALLDEYEEGMTVEKLDAVFAAVKEQLVPIIHAIADSEDEIENGYLKKSYSHKKQLDISNELLEHIGFDLKTGRIDETLHPFCLNIGLNDVRIGTHIPKKNIMSSVLSAMHEGGHGLYGQGLDPEIANTQLGDSASMGLDEATSRMYETIIGQGFAFWVNYFPKLQEQFPSQLEEVKLEDFYKAINIVQPSLVRIDADEVTYQMHIIMRYEIEKDLIEGKLEAKDIPKVWNQKMHEYLGVRPKNDAEGAFQDVQWSCGMFGYFPSYTLGNLYAAQIYNTAKKEIPDLEVVMASGNMKPLGKWMKENIFVHGKRKTTEAIVRDLTGEDLNPQYFIDYVKGKYSNIYSGVKQA